METALRTIVGATILGATILGTLALSAGFAAPALAGPCVAHGARSVATVVEPTLVCTPNDPVWRGITPAKLPARAAPVPDTRTFTLMLLAGTARMSDYTIAYTIEAEPQRAPHRGTLSASVSAGGGLEALLNAPSVLGRAFILDLGLLVPDQAASGVNPWTLADLGGVNTLTRPKASTWTAPNRNTMFSDLFGDPEVKTETPGR